MAKLIDISIYPIINVLDLLLQDKSTKKNIIWATDTYEELGDEYADKVQMSTNALLRRPDIIRPRIQKSREAQLQRTRKKAEVFTPSWLCNQMNNYCDNDWFGRQNVFNEENCSHNWTVSTGKIKFVNDMKWQSYVDSRRLEITCGEAPYLVSRYDVSSGELIVPPIRRIGILDRKLRIVNENTDTYEDWLKWTIRAFEASYGYEYQGDNVLIARINLLLTFTDYYEERWKQHPDNKLLREITNKIAWNIWQMNGLKKSAPLGKPYEEYKQITFYDMFDTEDESMPEAVPCRIFDWRSKTSLRLMDIKEMRTMGKKLFDYIIGNPPYQEEKQGDSNTATPIYHHFMDAAYEIADKVELIHPARFLFNAGYTPKNWNKKMLSDVHFKVLLYEPDGTKVFPNTDIKGGIAITYRDQHKNFGSIEIFTQYSEMNHILHKILASPDFVGLNSIIVTSFAYHYSKILYEENSQLRGRSSQGHDYDIQSNAFSVYPEVFFDNPPDDENYIRILGREGNSRCWKYIKRRYVTEVSNLDTYKVFFPKATGIGQFGEILPEGIIGNPGDGGTVTFISIGSFSSEEEALNCMKYTKVKFARALLSVLKVTQDNTPGKWKYVPLQDFTPSSDIDWSKSLHEIDLQLYRKYGLDEKEIEFIETHVKEMA